MCVRAVAFSALLCLVSAKDRQFPPNFMFGAATSSYQIEGGWNASGKGVSIWDRLVHTRPNQIADGSNGDVAADSYNKWIDDVAACADLKLHFYRFSIAWPRIMPTGLSDDINMEGVSYYNKLIDALLACNIQPMATLYHWDMPEKLQDLGGWTNPLMVDWFAVYARVVFSFFANRVKYWITINEPVVVCDLAYNEGALAPGIKESVLAPFLCNKFILMAHAKAYWIYHNEFKPKYHGRVSLSNHLVWYEPASDDMMELTELTREYMYGRYSHPIYSEEGGWPPVVEKIIEEYSRQQGFASSRMPAITNEEKKLMKGTFDFYAMNHYTTRLVRARRPGEDPGVWITSGCPELNVILEFDPQWETGFSKVFATYPPGIRKQMAWLKDRYGDIEVIVTENGYSTGGSLLNDKKRIEYIEAYLEQILLSIKVDKVNVTGYTVWSLIDNFEWTDGYATKFGLYEIDFNDPERRRVPKDSAEYYAAVIKSHRLVEPATFKRTASVIRNRRKEPTSASQNGGNIASQNGGRVLNLLALVFLACKLF